MNLEHHHVGLSVTDLDAARKWYADVLDMTPGYAFEIAPLGIRGCFMEGHGTRVELLQRPGARGGIGGQQPPDAMLTLGFGHIAFRVAQLRPDLLRKLVLAEPGGELDATLDPAAAGPTPSDRAARIAASAEKTKAGDIEGALKLFFDTIEGEGAWSRLPAAPTAHRA